MNLPTCQLFARKSGDPVVVGVCRLKVQDGNKVAVFEVIDPEFADEIAALEKGLLDTSAIGSTKLKKLVPEHGLRFLNALSDNVRGRDFWASSLNFEDEQDHNQAA